MGQQVDLDTRHRAAADAGAASDRAARILVVDDERSMRELLAIVLGREGYEVVVAENGRQALDELERRPVDLLISDIHMPDMTGLDVLRTAKGMNPDLAGIMVTAFASTETAIEALRMGAYDYIHKPFNVDELKIVVTGALERRRLKRENVLLKRALGERHQFSNIIGRSEAMLAVFELIETIAQTTSTVLVTGESGTGKELAARAIHFNSPRKDRPFVAVNCGALTETLLESELFGYMKGAFTGAAVNKKGLIESAEKGTLFLDEIGEMTPEAQIKILRFLQDRELTPLGATRPRRMDVRIIAATNRTVVGPGKSGLRDDIVARLGAAPIHLPPLRNRIEDLGALVGHFLGGVPAQGPRFEQPAFRALCLHAWPLNVRELEKITTTAAVLTGGKPIALRDLPEPIARVLSAPAAPGARRSTGPSPTPAQLEELLRRYEGNVADVSRELGKHRAAVWRWIKKFGLGPQKFRRSE